MSIACWIVVYTPQVSDGMYSMSCSAQALKLWIIDVHLPICRYGRFVLPGLHRTCYRLNLIRGESFPQNYVRKSGEGLSVMFIILVSKISHNTDSRMADTTSFYFDSGWLEI